MLTTDDYIDWKPCTKILETSCPNSSFVSNEVYKCKSLSLSVFVMNSKIYFTLN